MRTSTHFLHIAVTIASCAMICFHGLGASSVLKPRPKESGVTAEMITKHLGMYKDPRRQAAGLQLLTQDYTGTIEGLASKCAEVGAWLIEAKNSMQGARDAAGSINHSVTVALDTPIESLAKVATAWQSAAQAFRDVLLATAAKRKTLTLRERAMAEALRMSPDYVRSCVEALVTNSEGKLSENMVKHLQDIDAKRGAQQKRIENARVRDAEREKRRRETKAQQEVSGRALAHKRGTLEVAERKRLDDERKKRELDAEEAKRTAAEIAAIEAAKPKTPPSKKQPLSESDWKLIRRGSGYTRDEIQILQAILRRAELSLKDREQIQKNIDDWKSASVQQTIAQSIIQERGGAVRTGTVGKVSTDTYIRKLQGKVKNPEQHRAEIERLIQTNKLDDLDELIEDLINPPGVAEEPEFD